LENRLEELKAASLENAQIISYQLQSIDSSLLSAFLSVILATLIGNALDLLIYWIPASFFLALFVILRSLFKSIDRQKKRMIQRKDARTTSIIQTTLFTERTIFLLLTVFKNTLSILKAVSIIFLFTLIILILYNANIIESNSDFSIVIPFISSAAFVSLSFITNATINSLERNGTQVDLEKMSCIKIIKFLIFCLVFLSLYFTALFVLPCLSLVITSDLYTSWPNGILMLSIVIILLIISFLVFANYFSASSVKKEMTNSLHNLSTIVKNINEFKIGLKDNEDKFQELIESYQIAKRYEVLADDTLLINYYSLLPDNSYLLNISHDGIETTTINTTQ
jgi:hypothetical protein